MIFQIIVGLILTYIGFYNSDDRYAPVLFVEGLILINLAIFNYRSRRSITHL